MATLEQENQMRNQLKECLAELAPLKATDLARVTELGADLSFESGVIFFSRTLRLFHTLNDLNLDDVSYQKLTQLRDLAYQARDSFKSVREFSLRKYANNPVGTRDQLINNIRDSYDGVFEIIGPTIAFLTKKGTDFEKLEEQAKDTLQRVNAFAQENEMSLRKSRESAETMLEEVKRIAQESGVSQHAIHFKNEADKDEKSAKDWLIATVVLASMSLVVGIAFLVIYWLYATILTASQTVQIAIPKIVIFSILLSATLWAGRTYRAYRHNAIVNRHRQNALATFRTFAEVADGETKAAVLLQTTQCIFSPQQTGFIHGESESAGIPQVLEVFRTLGKQN